MAFVESHPPIQFDSLLEKFAVDGVFSSFTATG
jgi:hypothetical protein